MKEFSTFIGAVKKGERTDQYLILAAMYSLGALSKAVTVKEISTLLKLHVGSNLPSNINSSLRSYSGLVSPVHKGPPIQWSLTSDGLTRLRTLRA